MLNRVVTVAALAVGMMLSKKLKGNKSGMDSSIIETIEVNVPVRTAYNQWTQFEDFPQFMASVKEIRQLDDKHLHWKANVAGEDKEWDVEITEQTPDERIAWRSTSGVPNGGVVTFHKIADNVTRVVLQMDYEPEGALETIGDALGAVRLEARGNLRYRPRAMRWTRAVFSRPSASAPSIRRRSAWPSGRPAALRAALHRPRRRGASRSCRTAGPTESASRHRRPPR